MIVANFASVPAGSICRPITKVKGDNYFFSPRDKWKTLPWELWMGRWQIDVRATKRAKAISKKTDK